MVESADRPGRPRHPLLRVERVGLLVVGDRGVVGHRRDQQALRRRSGRRRPRSGCRAPTSSTTPDRRGRYNHFVAGSVYWTPQTGAWPVRGAILDSWARAGWERSTYGYPRSDEYAVSGGIRQDFERGSLFYDTRTAAVRRA